jgi:hypothetical protein
VALGLAPGCRGPADVTGLRVAATWAGFEPDQLSYALSTEDGAALGEPERRPGHPEGPLASGAAVVVYLAHERDGQAVRCTVEALAAARPLARGSATATVVGHRIVDLTVALTERVPVPSLEGVSGDGGALPLPDADPSAADATAPAPADGVVAAADVGAIEDGPLSPEAAPPDVRAVGPDAPAVRPEPPATDGPVAPPDLAVDSPPPPKERGQPCALAAECATGFCSGGVCCAEACGGLCRSCAGAQPGHLPPRPVGTTCARRAATTTPSGRERRRRATARGRARRAPSPAACLTVVTASSAARGATVPSTCTPGWTCLAHVCRMSAP